MVRGSDIRLPNQEKQFPLRDRAGRFQFAHFDVCFHSGHRVCLCFTVELALPLQPNINTFHQMTATTILQVHGLDFNINKFCPFALVGLKSVVQGNFAQIRNQITTASIVYRQKHLPRIGLQLSLAPARQIDIMLTAQRHTPKNRIQGIY